MGVMIAAALSTSNTLVGMVQIAPLMKRASAILMEPPEVTSERTSPGRLTGRIEGRNLSFRYKSEGGSTLSGGQRQRLLIARALVHKPRNILFDEATSALDNRTQRIVSESLDRLRATRIVIAHRLSTIQNADRVYVVDAGRVLECGRLDDLLKQGGVFTRLAARQLA